jgi:hypothetical protein
VLPGDSFGHRSPTKSDFRRPRARVGSPQSVAGATRSASDSHAYLFMSVALTIFAKCMIVVEKPKPWLGGWTGSGLSHCPSKEIFVANR